VLLVKISGIDYRRIGRSNVLVFEVIRVNKGESSPAIRVVSAEDRSVCSFGGIISVEALWEESSLSLVSVWREARKDDHTS